MKLSDLIENIRNTSSTLEKLNILRPYAEDKRVERFFIMTLDPQIVFNINETILNKIESKVKFNNDNIIDELTTLDLFYPLAFKLVSRELSGNVAIAALEQFFNDKPWSIFKLIKLMLSKDLMANFNVKLAAQIFPALGAEFSFQLAYDGTELIKDDFPFHDYIYSTKIDGRRIYIKEDDIYSKGLKSLNLTNTAKALKKYGLVFDGEIFKDTFTESGAVTRKTKDEQDFTIYVFDGMPLSDAIAGECKLTLRERLSLIKSAIEDFNTTNKAENIVKIRFLEHTPITNKDHFEALYQRDLKANAEGAVIKRKNSLYSFKRTYDWLKIKPSLTFDLRVIGFNPGKKYKKFANTLGTIVVDYNGVGISCSGKLSKAFRDEIWANREQYINRIAEIKCKEISVNGILREPIFVRFRDDKVIPNKD